MRKIFLFVTTIALLLLLNGCEGSGKGERIPKESKSLTMLFYVAGDNDLTWPSTYKRSMLHDILEVMSTNIEALENEHSRIFIYADTYLQYGNPTLWELKYDRNYKVNYNHADSIAQSFAHLSQMPTVDVVATYPAENSASKETLSRVIQTCLAMSNTDHYGLWFNSHGSGWIAPANPVKSQITPFSILQDGNGNARREMSIEDFAAAIPDNTFDFIVMELCLMASVEFMYEVRNKADYIVVSSAEIVVPGFRFIYKECLNALFSNENTILDGVKGVANEYMRYWSLHKQYPWGTASVIDLSQMDALALATQDVFKNSNVVTVDSNTIQRYGRNSLRRYFFDFEHYIEHVATTHYYEKIQEALSKAVVYRETTPYFFEGQPDGFEITRHCGLTSYIKGAADYKQDTYFRTTSWAKMIFSE